MCWCALLRIIFIAVDMVVIGLVVGGQEDMIVTDEIGHQDIMMSSCMDTGSHHQDLLGKMTS